MSDFVTSLRAELVSAAEREEARRLPRAPRPRPRLLFAVPAVAAVVALVLVIALGGLRSEPVGPPVQPGKADPDTRPLFGGSLEEGVRFETRTFVPALSLVAAGPDWEAVETMREDVLALNLRAPSEDADGLRIEGPPVGRLAFLRMPQVYDPGVRGLRRSLSDAPADLVAWLRAHPDLDVGPSKPVTIGGVPGTTFEATVRFDRPAHSDPYCRTRFLLTCTFLAPNGSLFRNEHVRLTVLATEPDPLVIVQVGGTQVRLDRVEKASERLLDTLRIGVR